MPPVQSPRHWPKQVVVRRVGLRYPSQREAVLTATQQVAPRLSCCTTFARLPHHVGSTGRQRQNRGRLRRRLRARGRLRPRDRVDQECAGTKSRNCCSSSGPVCTVVATHRNLTCSCRMVCFSAAYRLCRMRSRGQIAQCIASAGRYFCREAANQSSGITYK